MADDTVAFCSYTRCYMPRSAVHPSSKAQQAALVLATDQHVHCKNQLLVEAALRLSHPHVQGLCSLTATLNSHPVNLYRNLIRKAMTCKTNKIQICPAA